MYQARPYARHSPDVELTEEDKAAAELLMRRLTNLKAASSLETLKMVRTLPSGAIAIAQDAGGVLRLIVQSQEKPKENEHDGLAKGYIPMLFSGVIEEALPTKGRGVEIKLTKQTRNRIDLYGEQETPEKVELQRFVIPYSWRVKEFEPDSTEQFQHTQYAQQRPTWYSGAMAEVMQIVGGYGRQDLGELPDDRVERARMILPEQVASDIEAELGSTRLPGFSGLPHVDGQFQYDYKFNDTNLVGFDTEKKPWLIRVFTRGVFAMPLPIVPATQTNAFKDYIEKVGDDEILWAIERFGGLPTGETFPILDKDFEAWRRAGVIIEVCDTSDFYDHIMYSSACGWSMSESGKEGFNTCYDYDGSEHIGYGLSYKLTLALGPAENAGKLPDKFYVTDTGRAEKLNQYLSMLYSHLQANQAKELAIKYKLRRTSVDDIISRFGNEGPGEVDYWDNLEVDPIAAHSGSIVQVGKGWLYNGADFQYQPQVKFPEPFLGGCVSHNFAPLLLGRYKDSYPKSDTIMFGYYIGDELKTVKYYRDDADYEKAMEDNFEECMTVGSWDRTIYGGSTGLRGNIYTTDFDARRELPETKTTINIVGSDLGYDSTPWFLFDAPFWRPGTIWRNRYIKRETKTVISEGLTTDMAVCIPYFNRNAILYAEKQTTTGEHTTEGVGLQYIRDPNSYRYWTYDSIMHWKGGLEVMNGDPSPEDGSPVWVEMLQYNPTTCSDFADSGDWIGSLPVDYTWLVHPHAGEWSMNGGGGAPSVNTYVNSEYSGLEEDGEIQCSIIEYSTRVNIKPSEWYFEGSPAEWGGVFYRNAAKVLAGDAVYAVVGEKKEGDDNYASVGKTVLTDSSKSSYHFIGIVND